MSDIRIYVEGGGDKDSKARMREAFSKFIAAPQGAARQRRVSWTVILCGSRDDTFKSFQQGVKNYPDAAVFLLVDAEQSVAGTPREHLGAREPWDLTITTDERCQLMAQVMESWFLADPAALGRFYGPGFAASQIPKRKNVEEVPKDEVISALDAATRRTQKGRYHKIQHGPRILESLAPEKVRTRAPHCDRLIACSPPCCRHSPGSPDPIPAPAANAASRSSPGGQGCRGSAHGAGFPLPSAVTQAKRQHPGVR